MKCRAGRAVELGFDIQHQPGVGGDRLVKCLGPGAIAGPHQSGKFRSMMAAQLSLRVEPKVYFEHFKARCQRLVRGRQGVRPSPAGLAQSMGDQQFLR